LINKKIDISSIFPIIIKIIKANLDDVSKFLNSTESKPYIFELVVLVNVRIDNLNEFSKLILSNNKMPERMNKLIKNDINIKKANLIESSLILFV